MLIRLPLDSEFYTEEGKLKDEFKYRINFDELKIRDSKIIGKPEDKFETMLFLPVGEGRKGEGGLRTKGYFKFSYKYIDGDWFICDIEGSPLKSAPADIQEKINSYIASLPEDIRHKVTELPLITVITVVLNGEKYLEQTIQSVINQTYPNVEYIIIDGGSTDGTLDIIKKYEDRIDYWVSEKDRGIYDAMNKGIRVSLGMWIGFLGSDDFYEKDGLKNLILPTLFCNKIDVVYGDSKVFYKNDLLYIRKTSSNPNDIRKSFIFIHPDSIAKLELYKRLGLYDITYKLSADYEFFLRAYFNRAIFFKVDKVVLNFRLLGFSYANYKLIIKERLLLLKQYKLGKMFFISSLFEFIKAYIKNILKMSRLLPILIKLYKNKL